ncbi:hypothetical protein PROFUN_03848 [Planoprotostelium fungivorum]|uniref:Uncharacterized protein n=1 Tax=Planoprotostelium fungivorum TaxID=1890364 RepID=A0A2P6NIA2_9EUKA|nr:hypothetical protein PROFUN_03848 [Planoprotostelium fungivorum]
MHHGTCQSLTVIQRLEANRITPNASAGSMDRGPKEVSAVAVTCRRVRRSVWRQEARLDMRMYGGN